MEAGLLVPLAAQVRADFGPSNDPTYVFDICGSSDGTTLAASCSNNCIKLYSVQGAGVEYKGDLMGHTDPIRQVSFPTAESPAELYSCSADGSVLVWDVRTKGKVAGFKAQPGQELNSFSVGGAGGAVLAAGSIGDSGSGGSVYLWDRRTGKRAAEFVECHTEGVTQVLFPPSKPSTLLTGSIDGLVNVFEFTGGPPSEDDHLVGVINVDVAVIKMGLGGRQGSLLWVLSGNESLHFYDWETTEPCGRITDARGAAARALATTPAAPAFAGGVDYLVQCDYCPGTGELWMLAGSNGGAVAALPVAGDRMGSIAEGGVGAPTAVFHGGHEAVVRSVLWASHSPPVCVSGGEDSKLCLWNPVGASSNPPAPANHQPSAGPQRHRGGGTRHSPY